MTTWQKQPSVRRPEVTCLDCPRRLQPKNKIMELLGFSSPIGTDTVCEGPKEFITTVVTNTETPDIYVVTEPDCPKMYPVDAKTWNDRMVNRDER